LAAGNPDGAELHGRWLVESIDNKAKALSGLALTMLLQGRTDEALGTSDEALGHEPDLPEAHAIRACALMKNGDRVAALREFRTAVEAASGARGIPPWISLVMDQLDCRMER